GMMVASLPEIGSSYLLPVDALLRVRDRLLFSGEMRYGWIGAEFEERISRTDGRYVEIKAVVRGTPAHQAGIRRGDRLIRFGDAAVRSLNDVRDAAFFKTVGEYVDVTVQRENEMLAFPVEVVERPADSDSAELPESEDVLVAQ